MMNLAKIVGVVSLLGTVLWAQPAALEQVLSSSGGDAVSMDKEWAAVGDTANNKVHIYKLDYSNFQWVEQQSLTAPAQGTRFGTAVAMDESSLIVGAPDANTSGNAYFYHYNSSNHTWESKATISPNISADINFSAAVAVHDNGDGTAEIAIGAPEDNNSINSPTGIVYTYHWDGTAVTAVNKLEGNTTDSSAFGASLDMKGNYLIVGAPDEGTNTKGAAYTFKNNGTTWTDHPNSNDRRIKRTEDNKHFGTYVAINKDGNVSMIGEEPDSGTPDSRIYENSGSAWSLSHAHPEGLKEGVDIDDGVYMFARGDSAFNYFEFLDSIDGHVLFKAHASNEFVNSFKSVTLYKEQVIGNRPDNNESLVMMIPCGIKPIYLKANEWNIVSLSCEGGNKTPETVFSDELGVNYGDSGDWVMYRQIAGNYDGHQSGYEMVPYGDTLEMGKSYWIISKNGKAVKDDDANAVYTALDLTGNKPSEVAGYHALTLPNGTGTSPNKVMVGNPFARTVHWKNVMIDDANFGRELIDNQSIEVVKKTGYVYDTTQSGQPYRAITSSGTPGFSDVIKPYQGVWIEKDSDNINDSILMPFEK